MSMEIFLPGKTLGILGSGQLGRMLAFAAKRMGYRVEIYSPDAIGIPPTLTLPRKGGGDLKDETDSYRTPAGQVTDREWVAAYTDAEALRRFAEAVDVVTLEFENIPVEALTVLIQQVPVFPQPKVLFVTQNRLREKCFLEELGLPIVPFYPVNEEADLKQGIAELGLPMVLKTAGFGYDGKGQARVESLEEARAAYQKLNGQACVLEAFVALEREISVVAARTETEFKAYPPVENRHRNHILDLTLAPADIPPALADQAVAIARHIMETLEMRGLLCVEFFITRDEKLLVNELAPRPHNSGHWTIEGSYTSQFEQQLRAVCGLPLGDTAIRQPSVMLNLLGDAWANGEPDWTACLSKPDTYLHLYGKQEPRPGRKMGHVTVLADTLQDALERAEKVRRILSHQLPVSTP